MVSNEAVGVYTRKIGYIIVEKPIETALAIRWINAAWVMRVALNMVLLKISVTVLSPIHPT